MNERTIEYILSESIALFRTIKIFNLDSKFVKSSEFSILIIIYHNPGKIRAIDISNYLHCSKVYISKIMNTLIEKGFVEKIKNEDDARQYYLYLTVKGHELVKDYKDKYMEITKYLYEKLGDEKSKLFIELLNESRHILNEYNK